MDAWATGRTNSSGYFGHLVTGGIITMMPLLADLDLASPVGRTMMAAAGGLGAAIAILGDPPKSKQDVAMRVSGGVFSCVLFGPWIAQRLGVADNSSSIYAVAGVTGFLSWYLIGSLARGLRSARDSGSLWRAFLVAIRNQLPVNGNGKEKKDEPPRLDIFSDDDKKAGGS